MWRAYKKYLQINTIYRGASIHEKKVGIQELKMYITALKIFKDTGVSVPPILEFYDKDYSIDNSITPLF